MYIHTYIHTYRTLPTYTKRRNPFTKSSALIMKGVSLHVSKRGRFGIKAKMCGGNAQPKPEDPDASRSYTQTLITDVHIALNLDG